MAMEQPDELTSRVLRRAQVSKMTRALQSSLALANVKCKHGWENLSLDAIEPRLNEELSRKRPASSNDTISNSSSSVSGDHSSYRGLQSSPLTLPIFSDEFDRSGGRSAKRPKLGGGKSVYPASSSRTGRKSRNADTIRSWKRSHQLAQSSPLLGDRHAHFADIGQMTKLSFISEHSTVPNDPPSPELSEDDDADLPVNSFSFQQSIITSSPPRTPPPQRRLVNKDSNVSWSRTPRTGEEGADLLMFLAASPTPANNGKRAQVLAPSTPPSRTTPLPSSIMNTPGNTGLFGFPNTPSNNFNFADFCNVTPSPAQAQWPKTPATAKTPLAVSSARRRLNFDTLLPPTTSPSMTRRRDTGLGMELGGDLLS
ncbi:Ribosome bioproteinsis protein enp2 [Sphaceloma murrayae]|uniref:Ribosome bioproteinsis protein enp2 n=1 Tax=Sphaceloma murrayae TaxID=2082308 RepID=A0A2K1R208_9PEZI|nr:Ribosome bioproteinsis protein enp2 [Sphaceloma murrayae]